jgi:katanin p60 ATPase-containing subunit A1
VKIDPDVQYDIIIKKTKGYSGADISNVCREAAMMPMRKKILEGKLSLAEIANIKPEEIDVPITQKDFLEALKNI